MKASSINGPPRAAPPEPPSVASILGSYTHRSFPPVFDETLCGAAAITADQLRSLRAPGAAPTLEHLETIERICRYFHVDARQLRYALTLPGVAVVIRAQGETWEPQTPLHLVTTADLIALCMTPAPPLRLSEVTVLFSPDTQAAMQVYARSRRLPEEQYAASQVAAVRGQLARDMRELADRAAQQGVSPATYLQSLRDVDELLPAPLRRF